MVMTPEQVQEIAERARLVSEQRHKPTSERTIDVLKLIDLVEKVLEEDLPALVTAYETAQKQWEESEEALTYYGQHDEGCSGSFGPSYPCRCGWRDVAAKHHIVERWTV